MNSDIQKVLAELRQRFESIYGDRMVQMILFGSYARNEATSESDIDVIVVLRGLVKPGEEINRISESRAELSLKNDVVISCVFISSDRFATEQSPLLLNVHREGISV